MSTVIRRFLASRQGLLLILALEVLVLTLVLPRVLRNASGVMFFAVFFGLATVFYSSNYRVWHRLRREATSSN
jgi:hypothetical protein